MAPRSSCSDGTGRTRPSLSASSSKSTRPRGTCSYGSAPPPYRRPFRSEKSDHPRNRRRSYATTAVQLRAGELDDGSPALGALLGLRGCADIAAESRRAGDVWFRLHSCECNAPGLGHRTGRPRTERRNNGTAGDERHRRIDDARLCTSRHRRAAPGTPRCPPR